MSKKVVIVGCGWLGQQLAQPLSLAGWQVFGSRRTLAAAQNLAKPITGISLALPDIELSAELRALFSDAWVICTIPPGLRSGNSASEYLPSLAALAALCQDVGIKGGIHISSTGVYQGLAGAVSETAELVLTLPRVALLAQGEQILRQSGPWLTLRLAGLMGPGRHPGRFVQGKTISGAEQPVNMVHSADVAAALLTLFKQWPLPKSCYNLSSPARISKTDFYQAACQRLGVAESVSFTAESAEPARRVMSDAFCQDTSFEYLYHDARQALVACEP
ncbi:epimerase [Alishewanella sp. d11]|uniref:epimerase n=1 Tax=Alishewanella sp. d11 TaxID=3414030 RepID=UPI003BF84932